VYGCEHSLKFMLAHDLVSVPPEGELPVIIAGSGRKARDRIDHFPRRTYRSGPCRD
jgi:hypothetical protein